MFKGSVWDKKMKKNSSATKKLIIYKVPMKKFGSPEDIAWAAVYLASEEAKFMTGQTISPNGGFVMSQ